MTAALVDAESELELQLTEEDLAWLEEIGKLEGQIFGSTEPRLFTPPLRELTPATTLGFDAIEFARDILGVTLLPWQEWWLIHALELREDGKLRFGTIVTLVARQNGKTFLLMVLTLYFLYVRGVRLVLGSAQKVDTAKESWEAAYDHAAAVECLAEEFVPNSRGIPGRWDRNGANEIRLVGNRRYKISASTPGAGRGLSVDLLIMDEIRQQKDAKAWAALSKTTAARPESLIVAISNAGEDSSVVLNTLRAAALSGRSPDLAIFEWSAKDGAALNDLEAWKAANPALGFMRSLRRLALDMVTDDPETFRTECLCQRVIALDILFDPDAWRNCSDPEMTLDAEKPRIYCCLDVAPDGMHGTLVAAAVTLDGKVKLEVIKAWSAKTMINIESDMKELLAEIRPKGFGWFPAGPAAAYAAQLRGLRRSKEITAPTEACQELVRLARDQLLIHANDPLLSAHVIGARKFPVGDGYRFIRRGAGHVDAAYAAAGAAHLAQSRRSRGMVVV